MYLLLGVVIFLCLLILYLLIPFSPLKSEFNTRHNILLKGIKMETGTFTQEDIKALPAPLKAYFKRCGFMGKPKMSGLKAVHEQADFIMDKSKPKLEITYTQINYASKPMRLAFIDSNLYGIPFQGFDRYDADAIFMKGVIAKHIPLFEESGTELEQSTLVTILSESLLLPTIALQDYIHWEAVDDYHVKGTITWQGMSASGIFTFNDVYEMIAFTTEDRVAIGMDGEKTYIPWSVRCEAYKSVNGYLLPKKFTAIWHYETGDVVYFDGKSIHITYF